MLVATVAIATGCSAAPVSERTSGVAPQHAPVARTGAPGRGDVRPMPLPSVATRHNPTVAAAEDPLSTFALDVDTGAYTRARASLEAGRTLAPDQVRTEEFLNYFDQDYRPPADGLAVSMDATSVPWLESPRTRVLRVGVQSAVQDQTRRPPANLTFVIDISGSMAEENKLGAVKESLRTLVRSLRADDTVAIVVYSDQTRVALESTPVSRADRIIGVVDDLQTEGSTNAEAGLKLGYELAGRHHGDDRLNRVVLLSDGVANVGNTGPETILKTIGQGVRKRIDLVTVGFGMAQFNDPLMEQLADKGNGFYAYVDSANQARRLFRENLTGTLMVAARDAKAQVAFDPGQVETYRLLGYENRDVADADFRNDKVDGGEVGAGHSTTALYEVLLKRETAAPTDRDRPFATATVRYQPPSGDGGAVGRRAELYARECAASPELADPRLQQAVVVAEFGESLRKGPWASSRTPGQVAEDARALQTRLNREQTAELTRLTAAAAG